MTNKNSLLRRNSLAIKLASIGAIAGATLSPLLAVDVYGSPEMDVVVTAMQALQPVVITIGVAFLVFRLGKKFLGKA